MGNHNGGLGKDDPGHTQYLDIVPQAAGRHRPEPPAVVAPKHRLRRKPLFRGKGRQVGQVSATLIALVTMGAALGWIITPLNQVAREPGTRAPVTQTLLTSRPSVSQSSSVASILAHLTTTPTPDPPAPPVPPAPEPPVEPAPVAKEMRKPDVRDPMPPCGPASGDLLDRWIDQASQAIMAVGEPGIQDPQAVRIIIKYESSGNPCAQNNWDSNAARGTPSQGLIQAIGPTFARHSLPGFQDPFHPVDSIIAGVRYARARYGSESQVPGVLSIRAGRAYVAY